MKFFIKTLGCKVNWLDSARISAALESVGHQRVSELEAETVIVNSCTVTAEADRKSHQLVHRSQGAHKGVVITGCSPRIDANAWTANPNLLVLEDEGAIFRRFGINPDKIPFPITSRTRLPISIQEGCDNRCSFCITRLARGHHQTVAADRIIQQIRQAEAEGIQEIVLTGVNLAAWGCHDSRRADQSRLHQLLEQILLQTSIPRIRLSSLGPQYLQRPFFDLLADPRICDYLHLSIQSCSEPVLERMDRGHGVGEIRSVIEQARAVRPHVAIAADIISGFPGEQDTHHQQTLAFLQEMSFAKLHVFPYSEREGTSATAISPVVPIEIRKARAKEIRALAEAMRHRFINSQFGQPLEVLTESDGRGLSKNYIRVHTPDLEQGTISSVILTADNLLR